MRKITRKGLVKKLDKVFSLYIRQRYKDNEIVQCVTCGTRKHWKEVDAGHFVSRKHYATRWSSENVHVQCKYCNGFKAGQNYLMGKYIDRTYGEGKADELIQESRQIKKFSNEDLKEMIEYYKELI
ncbi:MAG: putative protein ninG [Prokaryotic dsDNA virus sp.]|nr:MAG: putative protein ninG [Prokaryotic dsDNA virus sp.]|tara:strand:- start:220 stop:597 length:378 start_codon:yes stop_codon:yes gene_type:complete